jgi:type I restriction enzyme M protein
MLLKGQDPLRIKLGDTLKNDQHSDKKFHFCMANPPYGNDWKDAKIAVEAEAQKGFNGRFGAGLPRINDGQLLFVEHFISKLRDDEMGGRAGIVLNGSPLFTGGAGSGESDIRKWIIENDLLEGIIGLPTDMFYNTGISTYIWILNNRNTRTVKVRFVCLMQVDQSFGSKCVNPWDLNVSS